MTATRTVDSDDRAVRRVLCALALGCATGAAAAVPQDPALGSVQCRRALEALQTQERATASAPPADRKTPAALEAARRDAASACLGARAASTPPPRHVVVQPPIAVAPVRVPPPAPVPALPRPVPAAPAWTLPRPSAPPVVTACDAVGCWTSDGTRLPRAGPNLVGPRGLCSGTPGGALNCP